MWLSQSEIESREPWYTIVEVKSGKFVNNLIRNKMKTSKSRISIVALASVAAGSASIASATVNYQIGNGGLGIFSGSIDNTAINGGLAGGIRITEVGNPTGGTTGVPANYVTVCTDLEGTLYLGQTYTYNTPVAFNNPQLTGLDPTWGAVNTAAYLSAHGGVASLANAAQAIQNAAYIFNNYGANGGALTGSAGVSGSIDQLEALQLAVWAALYDTSTSGAVTGTRFEFSGVDATVQNDVNSWLTGLDGNYGYDGFLFQPAAGAPNNANSDGQQPQELLFNVNESSSPQGDPSIPEPSTIFAGALMLLPLAAGALRNRWKKS